MPLDPSIYGLLDTRGLQSGLQNIATQYMAGKDRDARLSQLARQNELTDMQIRAGQRAESAYPDQQKEAQRKREAEYMQRVSTEIAGAPENAESILEKHAQFAPKLGINPEHITWLAQDLLNTPDMQTRQQRAAFHANPQKAIELQLAQQYAKPVTTAPSALSKLMAEREKIASINPQDSRLAIYDQMITKESTSAPQTQIVVGEGGALSAVTMPKIQGQKPTVTPLGVTKPTAPGKGGTPEEKEIMKEQTSLSSQQVLDQAEKLFRHPGRAAGTGASSWMGKIPGTEAKGFSSNLETFKSQTFLPMVSALKGMGALSDAEGKKITASVGALDPDMPEKEFEESLKDTTRFLFSKAKAAGLNVQMPSFIESREKPKGGAKFLGFE